MFGNVYGAGFWINPRGRAFPVEQTHINTVFNHPSTFGFSDEELKTVYDRHGEPYRSEAEARTEIIITLIEKSWIRLRHYPRRGWTANVHELNDQSRRRITQFFRKIKDDIAGHGSVHIDMPTEALDLTTKAICRGELLRMKRARAARPAKLVFLSGVPNE